MKTDTRLPHRMGFGVLVAFFVVLQMWGFPAFSQSQTAATKIGDAACMDCHDDVAAAFKMNAHIVYAEETGFICESCHGPGSLHEEDAERSSIYNPLTDYSSVTANNCLSCHNGVEFQSVTGSAHHEMAEGCSDCHTMHSNNQQLLKKQGSELCLDCHTETGAEFRMASHHPVLEGLMDCQSCHNPHGDVNTFATTDESRELCLSCHAQHEGPFVYEHQPVNENCGICHSAHGAVANNLLVQNEPALCMDCHSMHFHTAITGFDGEFSEPLNPERGTFTSTLDAWKVSMLTKCTQCHTQVHGSDLPSQGVSSLGGSLTR